MVIQYSIKELLAKNSVTQPKAYKTLKIRTRDSINQKTPHL